MHGDVRLEKVLTAFTVIQAPEISGSYAVVLQAFDSKILLAESGS